MNSNLEDVEEGYIWDDVCDRQRGAARKKIRAMREELRSVINTFDRQSRSNRCGQKRKTTDQRHQVWLGVGNACWNK